MAAGSKRMKYLVNGTALGVVLMFGSTAAQAEFLLLGCTANGSLVEHTVCGGAEGHGEGLGEAYSASPVTQATFANDVGGSFAVAGVGKGGVSSNASGSGTFGELHLSASADNGQFQTPSFDTWGSSSATAEMAFGDSGVLEGLPAGTPVTARLTVSVDGSFAGAGDAPFTFAVQDGLTQLIDLSATLVPPGPSYLYSQEFTLQSGDALHLFMDVMARADTSNKGFDAVYASSADVGHTGRLYLDILTPGASFVSLSGHNYESPAIGSPGVPEPLTWALMILGFTGIGMRIRSFSPGRLSAS